MSPVFAYVLAASALCAVLTPSAATPVGRYNELESDAVYFPDQLAYLRSWTSQCDNEDAVYWPYDDRCYQEMSQGPCSPQQVIMFDKQWLAPRCMDA